MGSCTREAAGRPGPAGVGAGPHATRHAPAAPDHPLQPLQGFRGPLRCQACSLRGGWVVPGMHLCITHPVYPPWYHPWTRTGADMVPATDSTVTASMYIWPF